MTTTATAPRLSVVIPTTHPWPVVELPIASLWQQLQAIGGELVIAHRGQGLPADHPYPGLVQVHEPGASVFRLRALGTGAARGEVIALTEDHVQVAPDFCAQVLAAHDAHPDALVLGGVVANGSLDPIGWASYFMGNINALPPETGPWRAPLTGAANRSCKRALVDAHGPWAPQDITVIDALRRDGRAFNDPRFRVLHIQSLGFGGSCAHHFHDGRQVAANRRKHVRGWHRLGELAKDTFPLRPSIIAARVLSRVARQHPSLRPDLARSAPMIAVLAACHCVGEIAGFVAGVGSSAEHIP